MKTQLLMVCLILTGVSFSSPARTVVDFGRSWKFHLGDIANAQDPAFDHSRWRVLDLPHDWSIEGPFSETNPATPGGGALPGGVGWYRKAFTLPRTEKGRLVFIDFDGVYRNSDVWINGHHLGHRPYGYSSFRYELTSFLSYGDQENVLAVRVDNSKQPNSRWYSGSGIYRNVWLVSTEKISVDHWGAYITTPEVTDQKAQVSAKIKVRNATPVDQNVEVHFAVVDRGGKSVAAGVSRGVVPKNAFLEFTRTLTVTNPALWRVEDPYLYTAVTTIESAGRTCDQYETPFGIRTFTFDSEKGFSLNGKQTKIKGVCNHHDLGCLGSAVNTRALERQLEIMKGMGVNAIRTSHNPPAPELLALCDRMGFIVMDESFDMWKQQKTDFDYALDWDAWHRRDLEDMVLRDRNHPSVCIWSIGNEVQEQWQKEDSSGSVIARELAGIVRALDPTRPITAALNNPVPENPLIRSNALDLIGYNYSHNNFPGFPRAFPGKRFLGTETTSSLATRGEYTMPSDSIRRWPYRWDVRFREGNPGNTCSSYDNCSAPWGSTHEETWKIVKEFEFLSGMFIWTGFDYLGEPTPYGWPSRSSYFGIVDLAGFPKDAYYMYQSEWTDKPVLHLFPHWNWKKGDTVDVWVYTNCGEVELFLNGITLGTKKKMGKDLHLVWRHPFAPGTLKAVGRTGGRETLVREVKTAGAPARIVLEADRNVIAADGRDLSFVTVKILDDQGIIVPHADNLVHFSVSGEGRIAGVDNGLQTSLESFQAEQRKAFNGFCLAVMQSTLKAGRITLVATSEGLKQSSVIVESK